jgi:hypothetical protein
MMTRVEQIKFIEAICDDVVRELKFTVHADKIPSEWDGHELRELIKDRFAMVSLNTLQGKRKRDYKNHCIVNNLP